MLTPLPSQPVSQQAAGSHRDDIWVPLAIPATALGHGGICAQEAQISFPSKRETLYKNIFFQDFSLSGLVFTVLRVEIASAHTGGVTLEEEQLSQVPVAVSTPSVSSFLPIVFSLIFAPNNISVYK